MRTIVDLTPINLGRDITVIRDVAERAEMQMIAATGFYWTEEPWFQGWEVDRLVEWLLPDIDARASRGRASAPAIIKCATDHLGVTALNKKLLQVAARLHRATGVPISTHTSVAHHTGLAQQDVFDEEGVDLSPHRDRPLRRHRGRGAPRADPPPRQHDRHGPLRPRLHPADGEARGDDRGAVQARLGGADGALPRRVLPHRLVPEGDGPQQLAPRWTFRHIPDDVIPALRRPGVSEADVRTMTVDNPRRIFERQGAY